ncbi:MAG: heme ABC transporter ATP-binding protein, partial [Bacteroidota bacterium]
IEGADTASYLLLDEPTSALDIAHQQLALHLVREVATQNVGVLAILHDLNQAAYYADRIALLSDGRILACGPAHEVLTPALLQQAFDLSVEVLQHPCADCPLIIPVPAAQT